MKNIKINKTDRTINFLSARAIAMELVNESNIFLEPVLIAWNNRCEIKTSPTFEGDNENALWREYGSTHGGKLSVSINGDYDFIFAESSEFESISADQYRNLQDKHGKRYVCQTSHLLYPYQHIKEACVPLEESSD